MKKKFVEYEGNYSWNNWKYSKEPRKKTLKNWKIEKKNRNHTDIMSKISENIEEDIVENIEENIERQIYILEEK